MKANGESWRQHNMVPAHALTPPFRHMLSQHPAMQCPGLGSRAQLSDCSTRAGCEAQGPVYVPRARNASYK
jgi:hypothetical protein